MELEIIDDELDIKDVEAVKCIGLVFRGVVNRYAYTGQIGDNKTLRLLKRRSCSGCEHCEYVYEFFNDVPDDICLDNIEHGKAYKPDFQGGVDYDSGHWELDTIIFIEVDK